MLFHDDSNPSQPVAIPWALGPHENDLDLEIHGCGCGCSCGGCGCAACSCSCYCSSDDGGDDDSGAGTDGNDETSVLSSCGTSAAASSMGFDPVAAITGEVYNPHSDENFIVTGARGSGEMSSPIGVASVVETIGAALGDPGCQSTVVDAVSTAIEKVTAVAHAVGEALQQADDAIQDGVDSLRR